ncbi:RNA polymerase sigma factor SigJ (plasmid) [Azospirillum sp. TSH58]|uniref:sigma-70 family RNA polymerase sigma factor n=1 Tax=Azospirillum sp. TSH58 TaxID=664962 RepID=UPI000D5FF62E|nr:sigma-70 family RNA polymerase sigma factor [Azospirillum sp. TSH58]AWJ85879.1 RNA polymerase sigma factor SigJ [Azospirillum sp. TSH58]PWC69536.1 RNA polymerase subunit sigma [Azospirillum sp. TSH58]
MSDIPADPSFTAIRPRLIRLAYRMLGSVADAEDVVQDAYLRWLASDRETVRQPAALLHTIVTRLCLNELKSARRRRETYIGPWLPEPIVDAGELESIDDITLPLMIALERLSPLERAAFLLHDVFGMDFDDVASAIGRETAACRKLASRAREHIQAARPRFLVTKEHGLEIAAAFFDASRNGDMERLRLLLADDVIASADGGGRVPASQRPLVGIGEVMARHAQLAQEFTRSPSRLVRYAMIDGLPGFMSVEGGGIVQTTALHIEQGKILAIYITRNPDKLQHLDGHRQGARIETGWS